VIDCELYKETYVKIAAATIAFSRFDGLVSLVESIRSQTRPPDDIIIVNQGTNQQISEWLSQQKDVLVITQRNKGSAGGFTRCILESIRLGNDWTWILDDDAIPDNDALEKISSCQYFDPATTAFISSRIVKPSGETYMSPTPVDHNSWYGSVLNDGCVKVDRATWLGLCVSTRAVRVAGLPIEEFFLWEEDQEFTSRLSRYFSAFCVLSSVITHFQNSDFDPFHGTDRIKYSFSVRNSIGREKLRPGNPVVKFVRVLRRSVTLFGRACNGSVPFWISIKSIVVGLIFFWPKVRYLK
jgi:hypothetical protein